MTFSDLVFAAETVETEKAELTKGRMTAAAFVAWQLGAGGKKVSLAKYLKMYGLAETEAPMTKDQVKRTAARALKLAEKIVAMDKRRKK